MHLANEIFVRWENGKSEEDRKKILVQLLWPGGDLGAFSIVCEGLFERSTGRKGENELLIVITQAYESLLSVWQASFQSVLVDPVYGRG